MNIQDTKCENLHENQLKEYLKPIIFQGLQMLSLQSKPEHADIVFSGIYPIIKRNFRDFTAYDVYSSIEHGIYKIYGEYSKLNPYTILGWLEQKRKDLRDKEVKAETQKNFADRKDFILCSNGGYAVLLGIFYDESKLEKPSFADRKKLFEENKSCPHTGKNVFKLIDEQMTLCLGKLGKQKIKIK